MDEQFRQWWEGGNNRWADEKETAHKAFTAAYSLGLAKGRKEGMIEAAGVGHEAIKSYRLHHVQAEEGNALHEITLIGDHIYNAIRQAAQGKATSKYDDGEPCNHPGCAHHITHSCEGCGRIGARSHN